MATAPPPQTMAQPSVQISYDDDDDDILMDYDDGPTTTTTTTTAPIAAPIPRGGGGGDPMQDIESELLAPEKVYLKGVDSMSTANVKAFANTHFPAAPILKVEWIDDSSCPSPPPLPPSLPP